MECRREAWIGPCARQDGRVLTSVTFAVSAQTAVCIGPHHRGKKGSSCRTGGTGARGSARFRPGTVASRTIRLRHGCTKRCLLW